MKTVQAILCAVCLAVVLATVGAMAAGGLSPALAWASLLAGLALGAGLLWLERDHHEPRARVTPLEWAAWTLFALFAARAFLWLVFTVDDQVRVLSPNNLGDLSLHLTYIRNFAAGAPFWPDNPIFAGEPLNYPIGTDVWNSLLLLAGVDIDRGLIWCGLIGAVLTAITLRRFGGAFLVVAFLGNGGVEGFRIFHDGALKDYQADLAWKSIPLAMFVTQRGLLYALPAGLLLLTKWRERWLNSAAPEPFAPKSRISFFVQLLLYATMPLFHLHTFLFLSALLGFWLILLDPPARKEIALLLGCALVPATLLIALETNWFRAAGAIRLQPGWMQGDLNFFVFWFRNFGLLPVLVGALIFLLARRVQREPHGAALDALHWLLPALVMFLFCCVVMLAPWDWDNTKVMIWSYLVVMAILGRELVSRQWLPVQAGLWFLLFFPGLVSLAGGIGTEPSPGYQIFLRSEVDAAAPALAKIPITDAIAGAATYNHPVLLNGHKMPMGYPGHLWSHGIAYQAREKQLDHLLNGDPGWEEIARALHVRWLFWGANEQQQFPDSTRPWEKSARVEATGKWGTLYDLAPAE